MPDLPRIMKKPQTIIEFCFCDTCRSIVTWWMADSRINAADVTIHVSTATAAVTRPYRWRGRVHSFGTLPVGFSTLACCHRLQLLFRLCIVENYCVSRVCLHSGPMCNLLTTDPLRVHIASAPGQLILELLDSRVQGFR